jgi:hypothetical protein
MAANPHMSPAGPIPVAAQPHVAGLRRHADDLYLRGWRSHADGAADVNHGFGNGNGASHDTAAEQGCRGKGRE